MEFKEQVENITSIPVTDTDELGQFLTDGAADVINRIIVLRPDMKELFTKESTIANDTGLDIGNAPIIDASLGYSGADWEDYLSTEWNSDADWNGTEYACVKIPATTAYKAKDPTNLAYRSRFNPAYYIKDGKVFSVPAADAAMNLRVTHLHYPTLVSGNSEASDALQYFCASYTYLIPLYASIRLLHATLAGLKMPSAPSSNVDYDFIINSNLGLDDPGTLTLSTSLPVAPSLSNSSISFSQAAPTFTKPVLSLDGAPTITDLVTSTPAPVIPNLTNSSVDTSSLVAPTYTPPVFSITDFPSLDWDLPSAPVSPATSNIIANGVSASTVSALGDAPVYTPPVMSSPDWTNTEFWINDEDPEMLASRVQEIQARIGEYSAKLTESQAKFNEDNAVYQADMQVKIQNALMALQEYQKEADQDLQAQIQNETYILQKFQADVGLYNANITKILSSNKAEIEEWQSENSLSIQKYGSDIQNALNVFNKEQVTFQADLKVLIQNEQFISSDDGQKLQKYGTEVQAYTAQVSNEIQEFQQNFQKELQLWQTGRQTDLTKYSADIQNEVSKFNEENAAYQAELQIAIQQAQLSAGDESQLLQKYQADISKYQAELGQEVQEYTQNLAKYTSQLGSAVQVWSKRQTDLLQKYATEIQSYSAQVTTKNSEYQWLVEQYNRIKGEYDQAFILLNPQSSAPQKN